ncbi:MAG: HAD family phosphatase [Thermovirgaceae bacterium]|nr:HAD family phosphatase [Thermovirgaceae bacterium]
MAVKCVTFDFGGVIAEEGFREGMRTLALRFGLDPGETIKMAFRLVFEVRFVEGVCSEKDFWGMFRERAGVDADDATLREMVLSRFVVRPWMLELAKSLKERGYIVAMLTDQAGWLKELDLETPFLHLFDPVINSWDTGKTKKDPTAFTDLAAAVGLDPQEILFVDDNEGNIERAASMGLKTILFRDRESFEEEIRGAVTRYA